MNELSFIAGINKAKLRLYENNQKRMDIKAVVKLGAALRIDVRTLIDCLIEELMKSPEVKEIMIRAKKTLGEKSKQ